MSMPDIIINLKRDGTIQFIDNDSFSGLLQHNDFVANPQPRKRASHVEPGDPARGQDPRMWYADMSPVGGPVLDAKPTRQQALDAEVEWLNHNFLTV